MFCRASFGKTAHTPAFAGACFARKHSKPLLGDGASYGHFAFQHRQHFGLDLHRLGQKPDDDGGPHQPGGRNGIKVFICASLWRDRLLEAPMDNPAAGGRYRLCTLRHHAFHDVDAGLCAALFDGELDFCRATIKVRARVNQDESAPEVG